MSTTFLIFLYFLFLSSYPPLLFSHKSTDFGRKTTGQSHISPHYGHTSKGMPSLTETALPFSDTHVRFLRYFSRKVIMTWATSQRCALPVGSSRPPSLPDSSPWLTAHSRASTAQAEAEPLSTKPFRLPWAEVSASYTGHRPAGPPPAAPG